MKTTLKTFGWKSNHEIITSILNWKRIYLSNYFERLILLKMMIFYVYFIEKKCNFMYIQYKTLKLILVYVYIYQVS